MHSEIPNTFQIQYKRFYGVTVSTLDFESSNPSSNLGRTFFDINVTFIPKDNF
jgi:hypothetical protein